MKNDKTELVVKSNRLNTAIQNLSLAEIRLIQLAIIDSRFIDNLKEFTKDTNSTITLDLESYKPNHLTYTLKNVTSNQLAVFSEIYYEKGWNAYIDGKIVPHFRANYILRAMQIPKGNHTIEFKFEPKVYVTGERISLTSSIILLLLLGLVSLKELKS